MVYILGKFLGGTYALSRYEVRDNKGKTVNWMSKITKNVAEADSMALWSEDTLCSLTGSKPTFRISCPRLPPTRCSPS